MLSFGSVGCSRIGRIALNDQSFSVFRIGEDYQKRG
nr:MAG TPA: hypothetical protein [Caudoviricetes sp.]